jgi:hypothetical protein
MSFVLLTLGWLSAHPAQAQYPGGGYPGGYPGSSGSWVPSPSAYVDSNGLAYLEPPYKAPDTSNTYTMIPDDAAPWWFGAYSPNKYDTGSGTQEYGPPSLNLNGYAGNSTRDPYGIIACFYDPSNYGFDRSDATPLPLDLLGSVTAKNKGALSVDFVWTGSGAVPDHADFLVLTHLSASAGADFGNGGATSGVSASAKAKLPDQKEEVGAMAGDAGSSSTPTLDGRHLVRVTPNGNKVTISINGEVDTDTSDSLPYATWVPGDHDFYYCGPGNGETGASAYASVMATASPDDRDVTISSPIEESYYLYTGTDGGSYSNRWIHQRDRTGAISVDSVAQWEEASIYSIQGWHVDNLPLTANPINFLGSPTYSWSLQGLSQGWLTVPTGNPTYLSLVEADWHNFPLHGTVQVNATDSDGAVASNTYDVTWHLPTENWRSTGADAPVWQVPELEGTPGTTGPNGSISGQWSFTEDANGKNLGLGDMFAAASGLVDPPWAAFVALTGIVFSKTQPEAAVHSVVFNDAWSDPNSTFQGGTPPGWPNSPPNVMQQYQMKPKLLLEYQTQHYQGDQYDLHGYTGQTSESYDKWLAWDFAGDFTPISKTPPGP